MPRRCVLIGCLALFNLSLSQPVIAGHAQHPTSITASCRTTAYYSPHGDAAAAVIGVLNRARQSVRLAIYGITHRGVANALIAAKQRGVDVAVKADKRQSMGKSQKRAIARLEQAGIAVEVSTQSRLLHDKFAVIDNRWVITGSFNWTFSAENRNRENLVILDCPDLARNYILEWEIIRPDAP